MATTSTLPAVKAQLVSLLGTALATSGVDGGEVPVFYAWRPDVTDECVFLGRPFLRPEDRDRSTIASDLPVMQAGRLPRDEVYVVDVTVWSFRPDLLPENAADAEARGFALGSEIEDVLADNRNLSLTSIQWAQLVEIERELTPYERGWASALVFSIQIQARLD